MLESIPAQFAGCDFSFVVESVSAFVLRSPIETPVQTSFGIMKDRPALYLIVRDTQGNTGIGEVWCNFPSCGAEHRKRLLETAILPAVIGKEFSDPVQCNQMLQKQFERLALQTGEYGPIAQSIAGIDIGLWDLVARRLEVPLHRLFGSQQSSVGVYGSGINPTGAYETFQRCRNAGYAAFKLKIGFGDEIDYPNIESICADLHSGEQLMVDANQAWSVEDAIGQIRRLSQYPLTWVEEPLLANSSDEQWQQVADASSIPLAAGENLADETAFSDASQSAWLSVMQPDVCKWGGFSGVLPVAREALNHKKRYCPHFLGGGVGLVASAHLLAACGGDGILEIDCNPNPLREGLFSPVVKNGRTTLSDAPGLGIDLDKFSVLKNDTALSVY